jgi:hypothetical protein
MVLHHIVLIFLITYVQYFFHSVLFPQTELSLVCGLESGRNCLLGPGKYLVWTIKSYTAKS